MKTPYLDQLINDLKFLDRTHALSSKGFDSLKEYNSIKQTLEELERENLRQSKQLKAIEGLKKHCEQRYEHWDRDEIERLVDSL